MASQMAAATLHPHLNEALCPAAPNARVFFGQSQHPGGLPALLPDSVPCDIFLFRRLIIRLKGEKFQNEVHPKCKKTKRFQDTAETRQLQPILK